MSETFERSVCLPVAVEEAFAWHERPGALNRLIPPWEEVEVLREGDGIRDGSTVELAQHLGPFWWRWIVQHDKYVPGESFHDVQRSGPFKRWTHLHKFHPNGSEKSVLEDRIEYQLPGGAAGRLLGGRWIRQKLESMFSYRHTTTEHDLAAHAKYRERGILNVAITGTSGLVGSTLVPLLTTGGHRVTKLVRRQAGEREVTWDPLAASFDASPLEGVDAVVHLAGENIAAARWTARVKERIRNSRVHGTRVLCEGLARMAAPPEVLVCASAIGFYGDRGDLVMTEEEARGSGFLAEVAAQWEAATQSAREAGIRVVNLRFGVILSPRDGALAKMLLPFQFGGGGRIGRGGQYWSWISIDDAAGAVHHALMVNSLSGPVNAVAPHPVTNAEFTTTLGRVLRRPTVAPLPAAAARLALGEMADELLLASIRVAPLKLIQSDYDFRQPTLEAALRHVLGKTMPPSDGDDRCQHAVPS